MDAIKYSKILVPTDGSDCAVRAGEHAVFLAKKLGARITVLNVIHVDMAFRAGIHYGEGMRELESASQEATGVIRKLCEAAGIECEELIIKGDPANTIVRVASETHVDCIVIGSTGVSALERVLIGSTSESVLRNAKCPVHLVKC